MQINNQPQTYVLTADIGGSHITAAICDTANNSIIQDSVTRVEVDSRGPAVDILARWGEALRGSLAKCTLSVSGLAVAMPGPFDYPNGICYIKGLDKYEALYGKDIKQYFADVMQLDASQVKFRNDAESTIAGEVLAGAGKGFQAVMGVTLGTGFGSAFSRHQNTADINLGSEPYKETIADDYLSTRWFLKRYHELTGSKLNGGVKELAFLAGKNEVAKTVFKEFAANMIDFLSPYIKQRNPEVLIICGNIAKASEFFMPYLKDNLSPVAIKLALLGENAPLIGAAATFNDTAADTFNSVNKL